jgi:hypothetical protein
MLTRILTATCAVVTLSAGALAVRVAVDVHTINDLTSQATAGTACLVQAASEQRATAQGMVNAANDAAAGLRRLR